MKHLKTYNLFEAKTDLTPEQEEFLNRYTDGSWSYDPATGLVDVKGDFYYHRKNAKTLSGIKFGKVSGDFYCGGMNLTSLAGAPQEVGGDFSCSNNKLTSLKGAPKKVGGDFSCSGNELTSLKGAPQEVGGDFDCSNNLLTSLEGGPQKVGMSFNCLDNKLTSLEGAPQKVGGDFDCSHNQLTSLEGSPQEVGMSFDCRENKLTSLKGAPQELGGAFWCDAFEIWGDGSRYPLGSTNTEWNLKGWLKVLAEGSQEAQKLISTILSVDELNKEIAKDPAGMAMKLKEVWNDESFKEIRAKLVWPKGYEEEADLVGDLDDVGF